MKIVQVGSISTGLVIILGIFMVLPSFIHLQLSQTTVLSFSVEDESNASEWCNELSSTLKKHNLKATVFVSGIIAKQHPECVIAFPDYVDIGSQTYNNINLLSLNDYNMQLKEIQMGKDAVEDVGRINSKLFKAPSGSTNGDIYSLLTRAGIVADFSYENQYNKYDNNQFIKYEINSYSGKDHSPDFFLNLPITTKPIFINFDNSTPVSQIDNFLSHLKSLHNKFVSASELTGLDLTVRKSAKT